MINKDRQQAICDNYENMDWHKFMEFNAQKKWFSDTTPMPIGYCYDVEGITAKGNSTAIELKTRHNTSTQYASSSYSHSQFDGASTMIDTYKYKNLMKAYNQQGKYPMYVSFFADDTVGVWCLNDSDIVSSTVGNFNVYNNAYDSITNGNKIMLKNEKARWYKRVDGTYKRVSFDWLLEYNNKAS